ncbi:uncharacterized protein [Parasteatoda tepidariorum]|uniref:uncharacterized protein isoform X2 n=1 Tax=Parasteatoda tepidariorum TaxID=114398 RepID=UPI0039BC77FB
MSLYQLILACSILGVGVFPIPIPQFFGHFNPFPPGFNPFPPGFNPFLPQVFRYDQTFYPNGNGGYYEAQPQGFFNPVKNILKSLLPPALNAFNIFNGNISASNENMTTSDGLNIFDPDFGSE